MRKIDRVASIGRSKGEGWQSKQTAIYAARKSKARIEVASVRRRRRSSVDEERRFSPSKGEERIERTSDDLVGCESAKSSEGRQRIAESHGQAAEGGPREREQGWQRRRRRRRRTKSKKILSTPLGNRRAAARNEGAKRTRDEQAKRERQIDGTSGWFKRNRRERRTRETTIYASQKSSTKRARPFNEELRRREDREKTKS